VRDTDRATAPACSTEARASGARAPRARSAAVCHAINTHVVGADVVAVGELELREDPSENLELQAAQPRRQRLSAGGGAESRELSAESASRRRLSVFVLTIAVDFYFGQILRGRFYECMALNKSHFYS